MHLSTTPICIHMYIHPSSTIVSLLLRSKFSFSAWRGWMETKLPAIHDNLPGFFFFLYRPRYRRWIFLYSRSKAMGSSHENNAFMDHFGECIFGKFSSFNTRRTLYYPVINVVSKHVGGWSVQWTGRGIFLYRMKICSYFQAGISDNRDWEIAVPGRKSRFSKRIFWDGGFEAVRGSSWLELSNFELCIRGEIWNRMERYRGELISSPRIFTYCLILVSICFSIISFYFNSSRVLRRFMKRNVVFNVRITFQINDARFLSIFYSNQLINYQII